MRVTISGHQFELTPALKRFAMETIHDPLKKLWLQDSSLLEIHLNDLHGPKGGLDQECRVVFHMSAGPKFVITEVTNDMRASMHQAGKRLLRRARKYIGQRADLSRRHRKHYVADLVQQPPPTL